MYTPASTCISDRQVHTSGQRFWSQPHESGENFCFQILCALMDYENNGWEDIHSHSISIVVSEYKIFFMYCFVQNHHIHSPPSVTYPLMYAMARCLKDQRKLQRDWPMYSHFAQPHRGKQGDVKDASVQQLVCDWHKLHPDIPPPRHTQTKHCHPDKTINKKDKRSVVMVLNRLQPD